PSTALHASGESFASMSRRERNQYGDDSGPLAVRSQNTHLVSTNAFLSNPNMFAAALVRRRSNPAEFLEEIDDDDNIIGIGLGPLVRNFQHGESRPVRMKIDIPGRTSLREDSF